MGCFGRSEECSIPLVVRNSQNKRSLIQCHSFEQLIAEYRRLFKVSTTCEVRVFGEDATEIDDTECLLAQPPYTVLSVLSEGEHEIFPSPTVLYSLTKLKSELSYDSQRVLSSMRELLASVTSQQCALTSAEIGQPLNSAEGEKRALLDCRSEDPDWFEKVRSLKAKSKKEVLRDNAKRRIKGYYYKTREDLMKTVAPASVDYLFNELSDRLQYDDYNGAYFQREHAEALCCYKGWFNCEGAFDKERCAYIHRINPYARPEDYLIFSTWNLDHQVERSRSVIPALREAMLARPFDINVAYFYELLFTRKNLRLVHVVCHLKTSHVGMECDPSAVFVHDDDRPNNEATVLNKRTKVTPRKAKPTRSTRYNPIC